MIKKFAILSSLCLLTTIGYTQQTQEYQVRHLKFKKGMADQGMEIGMKYFNAGCHAVGIKTKVIRFFSGNWDAQIMIPIDANSPLREVVFGYGNKSSEIWQEILKIGGSEENVNKEIKKYNETILDEEISYAKIVE